MINAILQWSHFFQNLNLGKNSTNLKCHLTISWGTFCQYRSVCKISSQYTTQFKIASLSLFQNLELGKAWTKEKCNFAISWARSGQYQCLRNSLSKYTTLFKRDGHFPFFKIWRSAKPRPMIKVILQFLGLDLFNIKLSAKFSERFNSQFSLFFRILNLDKTSTNPKCHLITSWSTSCHYQCVCKISS